MAIRKDELEWCRKGAWSSFMVSSFSELDDSEDEAVSSVKDPSMSSLSDSRARGVWASGVGSSRRLKECNEAGASWPLL